MPGSLDDVFRVRVGVRAITVSGFVEGTLKVTELLINSSTLKDLLA